MDAQELELDSESNDTTGPSSQQSHPVRKNIAIKLKGKGRGRGRVKTPKVKKPVVTIKKSLSDEEDSEEIDTEETLEAKYRNLSVDVDADISKLEAPIFTTIDRGPPEPMHRNTKLKWSHRVNLIGEKVVNPMIHCCEKCLVPILIYGRMIPCKHVFCLDCAKKTDKACPRCSDPVQRVEQTGLGTVFMCTYGGSRHGNDGCRRTYLSQRDLQAHINHRHLRTQTPHSDTTTATPSVGASHTVQPPPPQPSPTPTPIHHPPEYENRDPRELRNLHEPPPLRNLPPPHHPAMDLHPTHHNSLVHTHPPPSMQHPPPHDSTVLQPPPNYHARDDSHAPPAHLAPPRPHLYTQMPPVTAPPLGYASPIPVMSTRTNLITVPIQDDTSPSYHSPHQSTYHPPPTHHPPPQQGAVAYTPQHPPPQHPYNHPPPNHPHSLALPYTSVSQPPVVYNGPISGQTFSQPPPTHFPPPLHPHVNTNTSAPSIYSNPPPVHHPPPVAHTGPPPSRPPYSGGWAGQPPHGPPPRPMVPNTNPSIGPLQTRPPYYHQ